MKDGIHSIGTSSEKNEVHTRDTAPSEHILEDRIMTVHLIMHDLPGRCLLMEIWIYPLKWARSFLLDAITEYRGSSFSTNYIGYLLLGDTYEIEGEKAARDRRWILGVLRRSHHATC